MILYHQYLEDQKFEEFRTEILHNYLLPHLQSSNNVIQTVASGSLSQFPVDSILSVIRPIQNYKFSRKDIQLLTRLIAAESQSMRRGLFKGNLAAAIGDSSEEQKRLISFKKSILTSVQNEINNGRMKSARKIALSFLSIIDCPFTKSRNLLQVRELSSFIKNMTFDSIWQLIYMNNYLEFFWNNYLGKLYDELDFENHSAKMNEIENIISDTYSVGINELFKDSSSPQTASNILFCFGCIHLYYNISANNLCM